MRMSERPWKPNKEQLKKAANNLIPDIIATGLDVIFCGINPGLYSAAVGHHFARPGNRFWPVLYYSGFTQRIFSPFEDDLLTSIGIGITNLVKRATANAAELNKNELLQGEKELRFKIISSNPKVLAILGVGAYRTAFRATDAKMGLQKIKIGKTAVWVLPNPSGINANYQMDDLIILFRELYDWCHQTS